MTTVLPTQFIRTDARIFRCTDIRYVELIPEVAGTPGLIIQVAGDGVKDLGRCAVKCRSYAESCNMFARICDALDAVDLRDNDWTMYNEAE